MGAPHRGPRELGLAGAGQGRGQLGRVNGRRDLTLRAFQEGELAKRGMTSSEQEGTSGGDGALPGGSGCERARAAEAGRIWRVAVVGLGEETTRAELLRGFHGGAASRKERSGKERNEAGGKE